MNLFSSLTQRSQLAYLYFARVSLPSAYGSTTCARMDARKPAANWGVLLLSIMTFRNCASYGMTKMNQITHSQWMQTLSQREKNSYLSTNTASSQLTTKTKSNE